MNQFVIFHLLALFCISYAKPPEKRKELCKIKEARFRRSDGRLQTFGDGDVYLYKIDDGSDPLKLYQVKDNAGKFSPEFEIAEDNTVVTGDGITIKSNSSTVYISTLKGDNTALYQNIISLEEFDHDFPVRKVVRGEETLENVNAVKAKEDDYGDWIIAAVANDAPRLIFPSLYVNWTLEYKVGDRTVSFVIENEPEGKKITVEFDKWTDAKTFYAFVDSRPTPDISN